MSLDYEQKDKIARALQHMSSGSPKKGGRFTDRDVEGSGRFTDLDIKKGGKLKEGGRLSDYDVEVIRKKLLKKD